MNIKPWMTKHEPDILMGVGLAGLLFSIAWGVRVTINATHLCDNKKLAEKKNELTTKEIVKTTWKLYLPVAISTVLSVPCVILGNRISGKRNAALAAAYTVTETALQTYKSKIVEVAGDKTAQKVKESVAQEETNKTYKPSTQIIMTGDGDQLFYEPISGRYFKSNWSKIEKAAYKLNNDCTSQAFDCGSISLNDWFEALGLETTDCGDLLYWSSSALGGNGLIDVSMTTTMTKDNIPCGSIEYLHMPMGQGDQTGR